MCAVLLYFIWLILFFDSASGRTIKIDWLIGYALCAILKARIGLAPNACRDWQAQRRDKDAGIKSDAQKISIITYIDTVVYSNHNDDDDEMTLTVIILTTSVRVLSKIKKNMKSICVKKQLKYHAMHSVGYDVHQMMYKSRFKSFLWFKTLIYVTFPALFDLYFSSFLCDICLQLYFLIIIINH